MEPLFADEKRRMYEFKTLMEPVLHLSPYCLTESLCDDGFFTAPASRKYHGNYEGGLFDHSFHVTNTLLGLTEDCGLFWQRKESPYIVGMFHDLCKSDLYRHPEVVQPMRVNGQELRTVDVTEWEHNPEILLEGHGDKSVMLLSRYFQLTLEEIMCIRYHMGAFTDQDEWSDYTRAIHAFPNVLWTHHADMIASHILEIDYEPKRI